MASASALVTIDEAKAHLGISLSDTTDDSRISDLIDACSVRIERYCKTYFMQRTVTSEPQDGMKKFIFLNYAPVVSVTTIIDHASNVVPSTDYYLDGPTGKLSHWGRFPRPTNSSGFTTKWLITYLSGWYSSFPLVDPDLRLACNRLVALDYENPTGGISSVGVGSLSVSYESSQTDGLSSGFPSSVVGILSQFRRGLCP